MDPLLRAAIQRREMESALVSIEGAHAATLRCVTCGKVLVEDAATLRCSLCGPMRGSRRDGAWELFIEAQRAQSLRASERLNQLAQEHEVTMGTERTCLECGKRLRINSAGDVCPACRGTRAEPAKSDAEPVRQPRQIRAVKAANQSAAVETQRPGPAIPRPAAGAEAQETLRRFRLLAEAIGADPDEVLAGFASTWLARARDAVAPTRPVEPLRETA